MLSADEKIDSTSHQGRVWFYASARKYVQGLSGSVGVARQLRRLAPAAIGVLFGGNGFDYVGQLHGGFTLTQVHQEPEITALTRGLVLVGSEPIGRLFDAGDYRRRAVAGLQQG